MEPGLRKHKGATLRVAIAEGLPVAMWEKTRELLSVRSENQARGEASRLLWDVCAEADRARLSLILKPESFAPGLDDNKLKLFYAKFGFVKFQDDPCLMVRPWQAQQRAANG